MMKRSRPKFFKTKVQVFAGIAWILMSAVLTFNLVNGQPVDDYLLGMAIVTGICLLAWGMPFGAIVYKISSGQPLKPFKIDEPTRKKKAKSG